MRHSCAHANTRTVCCSSSPAIRAGGGVRLPCVVIALVWRGITCDTARTRDGAVTTVAPTVTGGVLAVDAAHPLYGCLSGTRSGVHGRAAHPAPRRGLPQRRRLGRSCSACLPAPVWDGDAGVGPAVRPLWTACGHPRVADAVYCLH